MIETYVGPMGQILICAILGACCVTNADKPITNLIIIATYKQMFIINIRSNVFESHGFGRVDMVVWWCANKESCTRRAHISLPLCLSVRLLWIGHLSPKAIANTRTHDRVVVFPHSCMPKGCLICFYFVRFQ